MECYIGSCGVLYINQLREGEREKGRECRKYNSIWKGMTIAYISKRKMHQVSIISIGLVKFICMHAVIRLLC